MATETYITGKTATVKNITDANVWTIDGDETRSFTCDNETKDRLFLESIYAVIPIYKWHAEVSDSKDATKFTILEGSTENSYKLTKSRNKFLGVIETAYFSVSGENYEASLEPSINNDWYFISTDQKEVYAEYTSLFTEAANLLKEREAERSGICSGHYQNCIAGDCQGYFQYLQ